MTAPAAEHPFAPQRRWSLRARLIALVLAVAAIALGAVNVLLPMIVRATLMDGRDAALRDMIASLQEKRVDDESLRQITANSPIRGEVGLSRVDLTGAAIVAVAALNDPDANPQIPNPPPLTTPTTVPSVGGGREQYRILAIPYVAQNNPAERRGYVVAWVPLSTVSAAVGRLILTELVITAGLLVLLGATASLIIRRELRPLESMATAADDIARGDLDRRVYPGDAGTEIGRLGFAFNGMLDGISDLVAERERGEQRMRQFLADASHELRTPVAAVRGYSELYQAGALPDEAAVARAMQRMGFEADRMQALVGDLLTLVQADAERGQRSEPVDLVEVLTGVVDDAAVIDRSRTWRLVGVQTPGVAMVHGDRLQLHQVFANLLANVRTHTDPGTTATVTLARAVSEVTVTVADNGPGVSDADLSRLFDRFYRVDASRSRARGGTGLGLSIVEAIVRRHRGRVIASHTPGGGLTTTVVLPAMPPVPADQPPAAAPAATPEVQVG